METFIQLIETVVGIFSVMVFWFAIQAYIRHRTPGCGANKDVLDFMKHGCAGCKGNGACHNRGKEKVHHELA